MSNLSNKTIPCLICGKLLIKDECDPDDILPENTNYNNGFSYMVQGAWGSTKFDLTKLVIAFCDDCLVKKVQKNLAIMRDSDEEKINWIKNINIDIDNYKTSDEWLAELYEKMDVSLVHDTTAKVKIFKRNKTDELYAQVFIDIGSRTYVHNIDNFPKNMVKGDKILYHIYDENDNFYKFTHIYSEVLRELDANPNFYYTPHVIKGLPQ